LSISLDRRQRRPLMFECGVDAAPQRAQKRAPSRFFSPHPAQTNESPY
jgi:hypothetical protein